MAHLLRGDIIFDGLLEPFPDALLGDCVQVTGGKDGVDYGGISRFDLRRY